MFIICIDLIILYTFGSILLHDVCVIVHVALARRRWVENIQKGTLTSSKRILAEELQFWGTLVATFHNTQMYLTTIHRIIDIDLLT
jgi:hypothetical protein